MLAGLTSRQLSEWMDYFRLEPFGEHWADVRHGILCQTVAGALGGGEARAEDFIPRFGAPEPVDPAAEAAKARAWVRAMGGEVK